MRIEVSSAERTSFGQSLMHLVKGNLGSGVVAMPASFAHCGLIYGSIGTPLLCAIATYCVHLLVKSSQKLADKMQDVDMEYSQLARSSFLHGPRCLKPFADSMRKLVDCTLIVCQLGICCVYLVFITDNIDSIFASYDINLTQNNIFVAILPMALLLSYIRTLRRLAIASACANLLQVVGISIIMEYLIREMPSRPQVELVQPISEVALGFGTAMFAFEGISVVLPLYTRLKRQEQMRSLFGVINTSYVIILLVYFTIGLLGYLKFGSQVHGSITLNLPKEPLYDVVRAIFTTSLFLTYPLQFYVPNQIISNWTSSRMLQHKRVGKEKEIEERKRLHYDYACRTILVLLTFCLALIVPKLNLMMDFFGSISGTTLSITLPPIIHLAAFWEESSRSSRCRMVLLDGLIIAFGLVASLNGSYFSLEAIIYSFGHPSPVVPVVPFLLDLPGNGSLHNITANDGIALQ